MLLASTPTPRPLFCEVHMGEPDSSQSTLVLPLEDHHHAEEGPGAKAVLLRPRNTATSSSSSAGTSVEQPRQDGFVSNAVPSKQEQSPTVATFSAVDQGVLNGEDAESSSSTIESSSKKIPCTNTSCVQATCDGKKDSEQQHESDAVREDNEECSTLQKSSESQDESQRQSPSPSPSARFPVTSTPLQTTRTRPLVSALKCSPAIKSMSKATNNKNKKSRNYRTRRRIRGLWGGNDSNSQFAQLHDETMLLIMKYLSMKDLCVVSMVCQRWKHLALHKDSWKRIDATDFVQVAYTHFCKKTVGENGTGDRAATKSTSLALAARMEKYSPDSLSVHSIDHRLSADNFLPSLPTLQELTLSSFAELTDTHIHVLLLSSSCQNVQARSRQSCILRKLTLEHCPLLTDATVQSVGKLCPELEELNLAGNPKIKDLTPLMELWTIVKKPLKPPAAKTATTTTLTSIFPFPPSKPAASPSPSSAASSMSLLFNPPPPIAARPSTPTATSSLQSLFAPPGHSPPRTSNVISVLPRQLSKGSNKTRGKLARINVSNTGVTAQALVTAWKGVAPGNIVRLEMLSMNGNGDTWNDCLLRDMADTLDLAKLKNLGIACGNNSRPPSQVTDKGIRALLTRDTTIDNAGSLRSLNQLNLTGHSSLTGSGIADLVKASDSTLERLILDGCKGIAVMTKNAASDFAKVDALANAISNCFTHNQSNNNNNNIEARENAASVGGGLRHLSLSRCFSSEKQLQMQKGKSSQLLMQHEETLGQYLLEAMGPKMKKNKAASAAKSPTATLRELDLTDCWFVTSSDVKALQKCFPELHTIHLEGTRAMGKI